MSGLPPNAITGGGIFDKGMMGMWGSMFGNPADDIGKDLDKIPETMKPYYQPYIDAGNRAMPNLENQYGKLTNDPGGFINGVGQGYQKSPGFDFSVKQGEQAAGNAAAAGGMAGSPQHEQQVAGMVTNLANQDYNNWLSTALGSYGMGLNGQQNLANMGYGASNELAQSIANSMLSKAQLQYAGNNAQQQSQLGGLGALAGMASSFI